MTHRKGSRACKYHFCLETEQQTLLMPEDYPGHAAVSKTCACHALCQRCFKFRAALSGRGVAHDKHPGVVSMIGMSIIEAMQLDADQPPASLQLDGSRVCTTY